MPFYIQEAQGQLHNVLLKHLSGRGFKPYKDERVALENISFDEFT